MAGRRTIGMTGPEQSRTTAARATAIARQLLHECSTLLELYKKKENFTAEDTVPGDGLVSVPPLTAQLDTRDTLWRLHSALLQCRSLLETAIAKDDQEFGGGKRGDYETQRKIVKERLSLLLINTGELLKAAGGPAVPNPNLDGLVLDASNNLFDLKLWICRVFKEVEHWTKTTITTLQGLHDVITKERARRVRSTRSALT